MENIDKKVECHIFVKFGSEIIGKKIGEIVKKYGLKYLHRHDGFKPVMENKVENYNKHMKIKSCTIYKFEGGEKTFNKMVIDYNNLEIITDKN